MKSSQRSFDVEGMMCANCVAHVRKALDSVPGVSRADVSLPGKSAVVDYDPERVKFADLQDAVRRAGYDLFEADEEASDLRRKEAWKDTRRRLIVTVTLTVVMMLLHHLGHLTPLSEPLILTLMAAASGVVYFYVAGGYHLRALKQLSQGVTTMDTLISMGTTVAFFYSLVRWVLVLSGSSRGILSASYFDVVGMIMSFVLIGRLLEERAQSQTTRSLSSLLELIPETALVEREGSKVEVSISEIVVGDVLLIRKGERIPVDGILLEQGVLDESSITGEPIPVEKDAGDQVLSGAICVGESVRMMAQVVGDDTLLQRIVESVRKAQASQAPIQRIADRVASYFVPAIFAIAIVTLLSWGIFGDVPSPWMHGIYFLISVIVIACPCALGLATPTAITVAMGRASEHGALIKDATVLETLSKVTDIVLDKTGTLTEGKPTIVDEIWTTKDQRLPISILVSGESQSTHPLAGAVVRHYSEQNNHPDVSVSEQIGEGLVLVYNNITYRIGKRGFALSTENDFSPEVKAFEAKNRTRTLLYYAREDILLGVLAIDDELREGAQAFVRRIEDELGIRTHLLSGDRTLRVEGMAQQVGVSHFSGEVTPPDKKEYIDRLKDEGRIVAMVGDGINDSPALAVADVSIAMGTGSDIANETAGVTFVGSSLAQLGDTITLSRRTVRVIYQNFFWAFFYNVICIPLAAGIFYPKLFISPMWAAGAMAMSSLCVVLNSLRIRRFKL